MIRDIVVPNQGLTITEATLVRWAKQPGETVQKGEVLFEIETDKAVQEVESEETGTILAHLAQVGEVVPLGRTIGKIGTSPDDCLAVPNADHSSQPTTSASKTSLAQAANGHDTTPEAVPSPRARRAAARLGIDLAAVQPTGARGRHIREGDVLRAAEKLSAQKPAPPAPNRVHQLTAERTAASFRDVPHFYLTRQVSAERLVALRAEMTADLEALTATRITITDFLVKALALTLRDFPSLNSQWQDGTLVPLETIGIGVAIDTPNGLLVPVLPAPDRLPLAELARHRRELVERARAGRARPEDFAGASFTLSNLGTLDVDQFEAIINPPQSGILAVGAIKPRPYVVADQLTVTQTLFLTLSIDHRVADGAEAGRFLQRLALFIERPALLCVL